MELRFASWNVRNLSDELKTDGLLRLLAREDPDILALQEVNPQFHAKLAESDRFCWAVSSLEIRPPSAEDIGDHRRRGCSLLGKSGFVFLSAEVLHTVPYPEQTLAAKISCSGAPLTVCAFHIPPGSSHSKEKVLHLYSIAYWLGMRALSSGLVLGMDANEPESDHRDIADNGYFRYGAAALLSGRAPTKVKPNSGSETWHPLEDTFRAYLRQTPGRADEIRQEELKQGVRDSDGSDTPLAVSYNRDHGNPKGACRYDFIYATSDIHVKDVRYLYKESCEEAGSDHAMVVAELEVAN